MVLAGEALHEPPIGANMTTEPAKTRTPRNAASVIGTLNEKPLHAALKRWYFRKGDRLETPVNGHIVDVVRGDLLVEIQTCNFSAIKWKLLRLTAHDHVRLVYPIAREKWILRPAPDGNGQWTRRKSPKRGSYLELFEELVSFPGLLRNSNFCLQVLLIQEEELRRWGHRRRRRRRNQARLERRLIAVTGQRLFENPGDFLSLIPAEVVDPFTTADLAGVLGKPRWLAQKMAYCLRGMGAVTQVGKRNRSCLYERTIAGL